MKYLYYFCSLIIFFISCNKNTDFEPKSLPNQKKEKLHNEIDFSKKLTILYTDSQIKNYETGYLLYKSSEQSHRYDYIQGNANEASLIINPKGKIDGIIHSHYSNLFPNFSASDISALYDFYQYEHINNHIDFIFTVVSPAAIAYTIKISDIIEFTKFSKNHFKDHRSLKEFEKNYIIQQKNYSLTNDLIDSYEKALLNVLNGSGLILLKSITPFKKWNRIFKDNDENIISTDSSIN